MPDLPRAVGEPMTIAYMKDAGPPEDDKWINFSDLIGFREPEFVFLHPGDLLLTLDSHVASVPASSWILKALYKVRDSEETGDAFVFYLDLLSGFSSDQADPGMEIVLHREEMLAELSWFPSPASFFKPFPLAAWGWLKEVKGIALPNQR